jgi:SAM-dependent methyltransferase
MHPTALYNCQNFFETYFPATDDADSKTVVEIGAQNVNGGLRERIPNTFQYLGVDFVKAPGVDVVLEDPYKLPFDDESHDVVISSSCFEHSEFFWVTFLECIRILKPDGLFYLNVPSNGEFHRYPVDCWRFYPDSGRALCKWANNNGINATLLESFTTRQVKDIWNDYVCVFLKNEAFVGNHPNRMIHNRNDFKNGLLWGSDDVINKRARTEDQKHTSFLFSLIRKFRKLPY